MQRTLLATGLAAAVLAGAAGARAKEKGPVPEMFDVSARAFARLELDDRVLYGPAYGGGFEGLVHVYKALWLGGYAEWSKPTAFSETGGCNSGGCERSQRMLGVLVGFMIPIEAPGHLKVEAGFGQRHHVMDHGDRIVSDGWDFLRLSSGYDSFVAGPVYLGVFFDWSMGCFHSMRRENTDGTRLDLGKTCGQAPFWVSTGPGVRAGVAL